MGIRLAGAGFERFEIFEKASGVGGTWYYNRYPGCACDIPSHLYSYSFEQKRDWSRPYAPQTEILAYLEHCARKYGLLPHCRFGAAVQRARWDEAAAQWTLELASGRSASADVVVSAIGMFNEVVTPDIPGLDSFAGTRFHSSRWSWDHDLAGEAVGVIGSAASAVQLVPEIAKEAGRVHLFQRTPNWVAPKQDDPYTDAQLARFRSDPDFALAVRTKVFESLGGPGIFERVRPDMEAACRANLAQVEDPDLRARLLPGPSLGLQAAAALQRLLPGLQPTEPRAGDRADRAHHREWGGDRRRPRARGSTRSSWRPASRRRSSCRRSTSSDAAGSRSPTPGAMGPRPTRASPRRAFRTSSCSTAPTPAPIRSSR